MICLPQLLWGFLGHARLRGKLGSYPQHRLFLSAVLSSALLYGQHTPGNHFSHSEDGGGNAAPVLPNLLWRPSLWLWLSAGLVCQFLQWLWGLGHQGWSSCSQRKESGDLWHLSLGPDKDAICLVSPQPPGTSTQCSGFRCSHPPLWCLWLKEAPWYKHLSTEPSHL